ncbi:MULTISPECIES: ABC transporter ATP-binding protein [Haloferax]|uniref:Molybdate/tungstate import ATP-binding protein WtpC n=1 Tax=Haloferax marisrubri TaxID=1544719 RepID=A0A2P4NM99_9EURY|nr:ABC transporter ATP-binding protein [Haloferax marisrubri]POG54267.1 ABC transporter [Haloferax marisrubri]
MSQHAIEFENVRKEYGQTVALDGVSFSVEAGTTTVLVGPSGCGKTTTMKLVNRLEDPTDGTVRFEGEDVQNVEKTSLRRSIGYVIQDIGLFDHMTVAENVGTVPRLKDWDEDRIESRVDELLALMDLPPDQYRENYPRELSGGQRQRVGVARALAADPDLMLMDEPFGALDPITRDNLQDEFLEIQEQINTTILFVTHDIDEALKMGDKIAIYDVGEVVQYDTPENILENPANEFVEDFIGSNRGLKKLQVLPVEDVMDTDDSLVGTSVSELPRGGSEPESAAADGAGAPPHVAPGQSAETALSVLLESECDDLPVVRDGSVVGTVNLEHLHHSKSQRGELAHE